MTIYSPYTYLIGWSKQNKYYYGVRYSKYANPKELWVKYFTSSKIVSRYKDKYGNPDIIQIRKIFDCPNKALLWEQKVLRRIKADKDKRFLNLRLNTTNKIVNEPNKTSFKKGNKPWNTGLSLTDLLSVEERKRRYGRTFTDEERKRLSDKNKERFRQNPELKEDLRKRAIQQYQDPIQKEKHRKSCVTHHDKIWITNGVDNKRIYEYNIEYYPGWVRGRFIPRDTIDKMINARTKMKGEK